MSCTAKWSIIKWEKIQMFSDHIRNLNHLGLIICYKIDRHLAREEIILFDGKHKKVSFCVYFLI